MTLQSADPTLSSAMPDIVLMPDAAVTIDLTGMTDLAPMIHRQRLVVEGRCPRPISDGDIREYLRALAVVCDMTVLTDPVTHCSDLYGWAGWVHWETSGAHFYAWERPLLFFSVDIYTCKAFDPDRVVEFTRSFFSAEPVVAKSF